MSHLDPWYEGLIERFCTDRELKSVAPIVSACILAQAVDRLSDSIASVYQVLQDSDEADEDT